MTIVDRILETKRREVETAKRLQPIDALRKAADRADPARDFTQAVTARRSPHPSHRRSPSINLIAEIKRRSPSAGLIREDFNPVTIARTYAACGAAAISVLTDKDFFDGRLEYLNTVKQTVPLPVLRKDFVIDEYQLFESRVAGADAVLLIADAIGVDGVARMLPVARQIGLHVLVEVHAEEILASLLSAVGPPGGAPEFEYVLGINNRDLSTQQTDLAVTQHLASMLPTGTPFVSESGLATREDVEQVARAGACAILVGESLLKSNDIPGKIAALLGDPT